MVNQIHKNLNTFILQALEPDNLNRISGNAGREKG